MKEKRRQKIDSQFTELLHESWALEPRRFILFGLNSVMLAFGFVLFFTHSGSLGSVSVSVALFWQHLLAMADGVMGHSVCSD